MITKTILTPKAELDGKEFYLFVPDGCIFDNEADLSEHIVREKYDEDEFDEMLDEVYGSIEICNIDFDASQILRECDPIAYDCAYDEYIDDMMYEAIDTFDNDIMRFVFEHDETVARLYDHLDLPF